MGKARVGTLAAWLPLLANACTHDAAPSASGGGTDGEGAPGTASGLEVPGTETGGGSGGGSGEGGSGGSSETGAEPTPASRCEIDAGTLSCAYETTIVLTGLSGLAPREVHWQTPLGDPPAEGWPAAIVFQGSLFTAELSWSAVQTDAFGYWNQGLLTKTLLDRGFVVITPEAHLQGATAWETNIPPMSLAWRTSADHRFMLDLFGALDAGTFGPVDGGRLYATGISSGGYMTSRMDEAYRERFAALAIHSASWATCGGPVCIVPGDFDPAHLPTLFLHGSADTIVPQWTMALYRDGLDAAGVETQTIVGSGVGHAWLDASPEAISTWFETH